MKKLIQVGSITFLLFVLFALTIHAFYGFGSNENKHVDFVSLPELSESLALISVGEAHQLGVTGRGVGVLIIDNFTVNPLDPCNDLVHGQWVKGIVAAVAPEARVFIYDVPLDVPSQNRRCFGFNVRALEDSLSYALANHQNLGIRVINYSIGGGFFETPCDFPSVIGRRIKQLTAAGILFVTAAGNNGFIDGLGFPECMPETISVGAVYDDTSFQLEQARVCSDFPVIDAVTCYSNSAYFLDVLAPGSRVTVSPQLDTFGTSASAPFVSGIIALMLQLQPNLVLDEVRRIFRQTGKPVLDLRNGLTFPRVDALRAVRVLTVEKPVNPMPTALDSNRDHVLGDDEILVAIQFWVTAKTVPGTQAFVDDETIVLLITLWVHGEIIP